MSPSNKNTCVDDGIEQTITTVTADVPQSGRTGGVPRCSELNELAEDPEETQALERHGLRAQSPPLPAGIFGSGGIAGV